MLSFMTPKNITSLLLFFAFFLSGCYSAMHTGGIPTDELQHAEDLAYPEHELEDFDAIQLRGNFKSTIRPSDRSGITFKVDESKLQNVVLAVEDKTLFVEQRPSGWAFGSSPEVEIVIESSGELTDLNLSGSNETHLRRAGALHSLRASGSTTLKMDEIDTNFLSIRCSGSSRIEGNGFADEVEIRTSGSSRIDFEHTRSKTATIRSSGSSRIYVHVDDALNVRSSGSSRVYYGGSPQRLETNSSGSSTIRQMEQLSGSD